MSNIIKYYPTELTSLTKELSINDSFTFTFEDETVEKTVSISSTNENTINISSLLGSNFATFYISKMVSSDDETYSSNDLDTSSLLFFNSLNITYDTVSSLVFSLKKNYYSNNSAYNIKLILTQYPSNKTITLILSFSNVYESSFYLFGQPNETLNYDTENVFLAKSETTNSIIYIRSTLKNEIVPISCISDNSSTYLAYISNISIQLPSIYKLAVTWNEYNTTPTTTVSTHFMTHSITLEQNVSKGFTKDLVLTFKKRYYSKYRQLIFNNTQNSDQISYRIPNSSFEASSYAADANVSIYHDQNYDGYTYIAPLTNETATVYGYFYPTDNWYLKVEYKSRTASVYSYRMIYDMEIASSFTYDAKYS